MSNSISKDQLLGNQTDQQILQYLSDIEDDEAIERLSVKGGSGQSLSLPWQTDVWGYTDLIVGYIDPEEVGSQIPIRSGTAHPPSPELQGTRVKITLERFWVHKYPGGGEHTVLCEFTGKNQIPGEVEELRFALTLKARDGSGAGVTGTPIFLGASVGQNGISFEGTTVNVRNSIDDAVLKALGTGPFRDGLSLLTTVQPALKPFVGLAGSLVTAVATRHKNRPIFSFKLGLDFEVGRTSACLRHGSFVVIQGNESNWSWDDVFWNSESQQVLRRADSKSVEYNYFVFRVSPFHG